MVSELFDSLLEELGKTLDIKDLRLDETRTCLIKFKNGMEVYIEPYEKDEFMLICTYLGHVPPGRYREDVFREALKSNSISFPRYGNFSYSDQSDQLILSGMLSLRELNGEKIASFLIPFMEKGEKWKTAIESGDIPVADTMRTSRGPMGMFGMRP